MDAIRDLCDFLRIPFVSIKDADALFRSGSQNVRGGSAFFAALSPIACQSSVESLSNSIWAKLWEKRDDDLKIWATAPTKQKSDPGEWPNLRLESGNNTEVEVPLLVEVYGWECVRAAIRKNIEHMCKGNKESDKKLLIERLKDLLPQEQ